MTARSLQPTFLLGWPWTCNTNQIGAPSGRGREKSSLKKKPQLDLIKFLGKLRDSGKTRRGKLWKGNWEKRRGRAFLLHGEKFYDSFA